jgi:hypothetical protein
MSQFLYDLIKNMTKSEKIHFKRHTKAHAEKGDKNYLKIYDVIEGLKTYDKEVLPNLFKGTTIEKYQSSEVKYLTDKILLNLSNFSLNSSKRNQIKKGILMLEVLTTKGFKKEALKKLKVLKKSALKQEEFTSVLRLIELEEIILFKQGIIGYKDQLEELEKQRSQITAIIKNLNKYHLLRQEVREFQFSEQLYNNDMQLLRVFMNQSFVKGMSNCLSKKSMEHWHYINVLIQYLKSDFETGLESSHLYVNFINENSHLFDSTQILPALSNYIYHAALTKNKHHFVHGHSLLQKLFHKENFSEFYLKYISYTRYLEFAYHTNDLKLMQEYVTLAIGLIEHNSDQFEESQIQYLHLTIVKSSIVLKDYSLGMRYSNLWHQRGVLPYDKVQARILSIILHFEVNYNDLILSEIITLKKMIKNNEREKGLINSLCTFFNSMINHPERKVTIVKNLQNELKVISKIKSASSSFIYFDYYKWSLQLK